MPESGDALCSMKINKIINELNTSKSSGYNEITTNLIKEIGKSLVEPLSLAINKSIATGQALYQIV